jgi:hypothetical protein
VGARGHLRLANNNRILWVDGICINANNITEWNNQAAMTSLIYGSAEGVCAWLGESDDTSNIAIDFIHDGVLQLQNFDALVESPESSRKWNALLSLMQRS